MKKFLRHLFIIITLLLAGSGVARAQNTEIRSRIAAVRIIVVNERGQISQIYRNTSSAVKPDVRLITPAGQQLLYTPAIDQQYASIESTLTANAIGKVYEHQQLPSLIETLYAML